MTNTGITRRAALAGVGSSVIALTGGTSDAAVSAPAARSRGVGSGLARQSYTGRVEIADTLDGANQQAQSMRVGDQIKVLRHSSAGSLGGFDGMVERNPSPLNPGGGRIRPIDTNIRPQWWGGGAGNPELDATSLEQAANFLAQLGHGKLVISERLILRRPVQMNIPEWSTIDADGAVFVFDSEFAIIDVNPSADTQSRRSLTTLRGVNWRGGRFLRSRKDQTGVAFKPPLVRQFSMREAYFEGFKRALELSGKDTITIADNYFYLNETGIEFISGLIPDQSLAGNAPLTVNIERNHFSITGMRHAIAVREKIIGISISNNAIAGESTGAQIAIEDGPSNIRAERYEIVGNHLEQMGTGGAISVTAPNRNGIRGLTITENSFAASSENSRNLIVLRGTQTTHVARNTLYLGNPPQGTNALILVDADRSNTDLWIDHRQYIGGQKTRMALLPDSQFRENPEIHIFPDRIAADATLLGSWFSGTAALPRSGRIEILRDLQSQSKATVPQSLKLTPRRIRVSGYIEALYPKAGTPGTERITFAPSSRSLGIPESSHTFQLNKLEQGGRVNVEMLLSVDPDEGSIVFLLDEEVAGSSRAYLRVDEFYY